jgi:hypothetical protein
MTERSLHKDRIEGLEASLKGLREKKELFLKAKGLHEEEEKLRAEGNKIRTDITDAKVTLKDLMERKNTAMQTVTSAMAAKMNAVLPMGSAVIEIRDDGTLFIGWNNGKGTTSYPSLSGGEKAAFDPALCKALGGTILLVEAAEIDDSHLTDALRKYEASGMQVIVNTCHAPEVIPLAWGQVRI